MRQCLVRNLSAQCDQRDLRYLPRGIDKPRQDCPAALEHVPQDFRPETIRRDGEFSPHRYPQAKHMKTRNHAVHDDHGGILLTAVVIGGVLLIALAAALSLSSSHNETTVRSGAWN